MQIRITFMSIALLSFQISSLGAQESDQRLWVTVQAASAEERTAIASRGICIEDVTDETMAGIADQACIDELVSSGFTIQESMKLDQYLHQAIDAQTTRAGYQFSTFENMTTRLQNLATTHHDIVALYTIGRTCENRDLWMLQFSAAGTSPRHAQKPGILFVGNHHAREHLSAEVCLSLAVYLCEHKKSPEISALLNSVDIYILPIFNPDGVVYDFSKRSYACWKKIDALIRINQSV